MFILATKIETCCCINILLIKSQKTKKYITALIKGTTSGAGLTRGVLLVAKGYASGDDSEEL